MSSAEEPTAAPPAEETPAKTPAETPANTATETTAEESSLAQAQVDGSGPPGNGSNMVETEFNVEVKLADMQADPNNPLFSAKTFEELKL
jgi:ATP-dependent RNA helicase DDX19/DBP5